ncbi:Obg family GTPase CgtA, partial [Schnuerera sp.]|uniref:Obg family GTPase CgtA n=1 Tax=Schnuerera sp. TaxID=2794844 RepID=UPI002BC008D6
EGAHEGVGLGHDFLRHVERTKLLVHVLDSSGIEGRNPIEDFYKINEELTQYNPKLKDKLQIIAANKIDLPQSEEWIDKLKEEFEPLGYKIFSLSAATMKGINELKFGIWEALKDIEVGYETFDEKADIIIEKPIEDDIIVKKENGTYIVEGSFIERLLYSINFDNLDSLRYFQNIMKQRGVVEQLKKLGIKENDSVFICGYEFEFFD